VDSEFILVGTDRDASGIPWALLASDRNGALEFVGPAILNPPQAQQGRIRRSADPAVQIHRQERAMAVTLLFDTCRFTVIRHSSGGIEIAPKTDPGATRIFHKHAKRYADDLQVAFNCRGDPAVDSRCGHLLAGWPSTELNLDWDP